MRTRTVILLMLSIYAVTLGLFFVTSVRTVTFFPIAQSYSWQIVPLANNGGSDNFEITSWHNQHDLRGWIAFNISSVPQNVWVQSATLRLRLWQKTTNQTEIGDSTGRIYTVYMLTQPGRAPELIGLINPFGLIITPHPHQYLQAKEDGTVH